MWIGREWVAVGSSFLGGDSWLHGGQKKSDAGRKQMSLGNSPRLSTESARGS